MKRKYNINTDIQKDIEDFVVVLDKNKIKFEKIILFGSYAKGKHDINSDIDLAVISDDFGKDQIDEMILLSKLSWQASDRIESVALSHVDLESKYNPLIGEIKKYGKEVYSSDTRLNK